MTGSDSVLVVVVSQHAMNWLGGLILCGLVLGVLALLIWRETGR